MRRIVEITGLDEWVKDGKKHFRTHAKVMKDNNPLDIEEVSGYGKDYDVDELVEVFYDTEWNQAKMQKHNA